MAGMGMPLLPDHLELALAPEDAEGTQAQMLGLREEFVVDPWRIGLRGWLLRAMAAGEATPAGPGSTRRCGSVAAQGGLPGNPASTSKSLSFTPRAEATGRRCGRGGAARRKGNSIAVQHGDTPIPPGIRDWFLSPWETWS
jgi:hypothetical protein